VLKSIFYQLAIFFKGIQMANQTFKVAGITVHNGNAKVRFTDDMVRRVKQFTKGGATRCDFVELPSEMTKVEALKYLQAHADFQSPSDQATLSDALVDRVKESSKGEVKVKVTKPSLDSIKARAKTSVKATAPETTE
jgi:hypothetical protein